MFARIAANRLITSQALRLKACSGSTQTASITAMVGADMPQPTLSQRRQYMNNFDFSSLISHITIGLPALAMIVLLTLGIAGKAAAK